MHDQREAQKNYAVRWFEEVWNKSRREAIDEMFPADCVLHDGSNVMRGPEEFKAFYDTLRAQISNVRVTPLETISEGNLVCIRWSSSAIHTASGKRVEVTGMSLLRFQDGRFVEAWQNWDQHALFQQIEGSSPQSFSQAAG